jgi:hypothetical protein
MMDICIMYLTPDLVRSELDYEMHIYSNLNGRSVGVNFDPCYGRLCPRAIG